MSLIIIIWLDKSYANQNCQSSCKVAWPSWSKALDLSYCLIPNGRESARVRTSPLPYVEPIFFLFCLWNFNIFTRVFYTLQLMYQPCTCLEPNLLLFNGDATT